MDDPKHNPGEPEFGDHAEDAARNPGEQQFGEQQETTEADSPDEDAGA